MLKAPDFATSAHPTSSSIHHHHHHHNHYSPLIDGSFEAKRSAKNCRHYRLIRHDETTTGNEEEEDQQKVMVDTVTTDDSLCGDNYRGGGDESRSNSTMGGLPPANSIHVPPTPGKRKTIGGVPFGRPKTTTTGADDDDDEGRGKESSGGAGGGGSTEWTKVLFLFFFLLIAGVSNWAVIAYTHDFVPREPLPDIVFSLVPEQRWASSLGDICVAVCIAVLAALLVVHQHRGTILKRVVFCAATLYAMRSVTLAVTQLPSAYANNSGRCRERVTPQFAIFMSRLIEQTIRIGFQSKDQMLCGDLLFSGHTLVMVTCSLAVAYYLPRSIKPLQWLTHISCAIGMVCMIVSRTHYTIDVVIAYWLGNMVFRIYHAYCEVDMCMERQKSILYSWWPCRIIDWLEENIVPGRLENRCHWPPFCGSGDTAATWHRRRATANGTSGGGTSSSESSTCETNTAQQHHKQVSISSSSTYQLPC